MRFFALKKSKPLELCPHCMNITKICRTPKWKAGTMTFADAVGLMIVALALGLLIGRFI